MRVEVGVAAAVAMLVLWALAAVLFRVLFPPAPSARRSLDAEWDADARLVIVASHFSEDLTWLRKSPVPVVVCSKRFGSRRCDLIPNRGREASAYLKFVVQNYDVLPRSVAFIHGHEHAWHQSPKSLLDAIMEARTDVCPFISLNDHWIDDRDGSSPGVQEMRRVWDEIFRPFLGRDCPGRLLHDCCAQFIVARSTIRRHARSAYETWLKYSIEGCQDPALTGLVFEYLWPVLFGEGDVVDRAAHREACHSHTRSG